MTVYYNEFDPKAAAWLRELIKEGHIAYGEVDERSITEVRPTDLAGYTQCHFFAGIGGWSYALRLAGWPDDRPVWTGSCPCQPFSVAGRRGGADDARHLWPEFYRLIRECRPATVFGEQVASKDGFAWLDIVSTDLEGADYAIGAADLCAAGVGAPHIRQRLYFMAHDDTAGRSFKRSAELLHSERASLGNDPDGRGAANELAFSEGQQYDGSGNARAWRGESTDSRDVGHTHVAGSQGRGERGDSTDQRITGASSVGGELAHTNGCGFWQSEFIQCTDGKARPVEPGSFPLAHGVPGRVGLLRGYGNAIVPQVAATFIEAYS